MKNNTEKDWTGNKNSIFKTLGASNHTDKERQNEDYYATDPIAIDVLLKDGGVTFDKPIWECSCGEGHLSERLKSFGYEVRSTDLIDRGYGEGGIDFLTYNQPWNGDILTNPPYKYAKEFIEHVENVEDISILEDSSVEKGGVIVETDFGSIDARISSQLTELENKILEVSPLKSIKRQDSLTQAE